MPGTCIMSSMVGKGPLASYCAGARAQTPLTRWAKLALSFALLGLLAPPHAPSPAVISAITAIAIERRTESHDVITASVTASPSGSQPTRRPRSGEAV